MSPARKRGTPAAASAKAGQAMVEAILALLLVFFAVFALAQFADNLRTRLLVDYAALRAARARAVGFNDYMVLKTARACTIPVAGECYTTAPQGNTLTRSQRSGRIADYLATGWETQAASVLDFEYWRNGRTTVNAPDCRGLLEVSVEQRRPQFFSIANFASGLPDSAERDDARIRSSASIESHYPDYLQ